ncbi:MAG: hypothetical protein HY092_01105 [Candidatus Kerfeldbacteria bacterium]|nr:hypothetical protein [Candidatus Kerfeldbacteria bacterium]
MFVDVRTLPPGVPVQICGYGFDGLPEEYRFDNATFITDVLSKEGRDQLFQDVGQPGMTERELVAAGIAKFVKETGIESRYMVRRSSDEPNPVAELGFRAARMALKDSGLREGNLDLMFCASNTREFGYPSTATRIKKKLGLPMGAYCCDLQDACQTGAAVLFTGWMSVRTGASRMTLAICAEETTRLAPQEEYKHCNLFGDGASALLLTPADLGNDEQFLFFDFDTDTAAIDMIYQTKTGFFQEGPLVHKYVGEMVAPRIAAALEQANIDPAQIDHFIPHQPSGKTIDWLVSRLHRLCPTFRPEVVRRHVSSRGNMSCASTGHLLSTLVLDGTIEPDDLVVVYTFGSGIGIGGYGMRMKRA